MEHPIATIIERNGAPKIAEQLGVSLANVRMWKMRKRIPQDRWADMAEKRLATLDELARASRNDAPRKARQQAAA